MQHCPVRHSRLELTDLTVVTDNTHLNRWLAQIIYPLTASLRVDGALCVDVAESQTIWCSTRGFSSCVAATYRKHHVCTEHAATMVKCDSCHSEHMTYGLMYRGGGVLKDGSATMAETNLWTDHARVCGRGVGARWRPGERDAGCVVDCVVDRTRKLADDDTRLLQRFLGVRCVWWRHWLWSLVFPCGTFVCRREKSELSLTVWARPQVATTGGVCIPSLSTRTSRRWTARPCTAFAAVNGTSSTQHVEPLADAVHLFVDDILSSGGALILSVIVFPTNEVSDQCFNSGGTHQSLWKLVVRGFQTRNLLSAEPTISTQCVPKGGSLMESLHSMRSMYNMRGLRSMCFLHEGGFVHSSTTLVALGAPSFLIGFVQLLIPHEVFISL